LRTIVGLSMNELEFEFFTASIDNRSSVVERSFDLVLSIETISI
jgi:hypothetical protein